MAPNAEALVKAGTTVAGASGNGAAGTILSSVAGGASLGLTLGTVVPGIGNAVGAAIGAVGGLIVGLFKNKKKKEAAAKAAEVENPVKAEDKSGTTTVGDVAKPGLLKTLGIVGDTGKLTKGGKIGLIAGGVSLLAGIGILIGNKIKKNKKAAAEAAKLAEANKIDPPQTLVRPTGYDPFAGRQDYFSSPYSSQNYSRPVFGFGPNYGTYPPPRPMMQPVRPQFRPRMAQFNTPNPFGNSFGPRPPYGRFS